MGISFGYQGVATQQNGVSELSPKWIRFMSATPITGSLQSYQMMVYRLPLHPEFFQLAGRKKLTHPNYEFEGWVFRGGHVLRFELARERYLGKRGQAISL